MASAEIVNDLPEFAPAELPVAVADVIFNLAGQIAHNDSITNPLYDAKLNYLYQLN